MRTKFGMKGDEEEDEDELEKKELEEHERRAKHSIEGILGDRCEWVCVRVSVCGCVRARRSLRCLLWLVVVVGTDRGSGGLSVPYQRASI